MSAATSPSGAGKRRTGAAPDDPIRVKDELRLQRVKSAVMASTCINAYASKFPKPIVAKNPKLPGLGEGRLGCVAAGVMPLPSADARVATNQVCKTMILDRGAAEPHRERRRGQFRRIATLTGFLNDLRVALAERTFGIH